MKKLLLPLLYSIVGAFLFCPALAQSNKTLPEETIFIFGGDFNRKFVQYIKDLTYKQDPNICYLPTASADNQENIKYWETICKNIGIKPIILKVWVSSSPENKTFEEILQNTDAIVVGGGNTLNMMGIWKAQGIDTLLYNALKKGVILAGGSAGSICWFQNGVSDSRPVSLSLVNGLGYLPYSHCPHYSEEIREALYHQLIANHEIPAGFGCDELAGILFKNGKAVEFVSQSDKHHSYFVYNENGTVQTTEMKSRILINTDALSENDYTSLTVNKKIGELLISVDQIPPLAAYIAIQKKLRLDKKDINENERNRILNINIEKIFIYNHQLAGIINDAYINSLGYGLGYLYNCDGVWKSIGEDIGGATLFESEITFREKAKIIIERAEKQFITSD